MLTREQFKEKYGVHISTNLKDKMKGVWSVSTSVTMNPLCQARRNCDGMVCKHCYAATGLKLHPSVRACYERNTVALTTILIPEEDMPLLGSPSGYFRFESHGDIINEIQVVNYFRMAKMNPQMKCALWTKNPWIIRSAMKNYGIEKPANLVIIGSSYYTDKAMQYSAYEFIDKVFTVYKKTTATANNIDINCGARSCATCGRCYENKGGREVSELLK